MSSPSGLCRLEGTEDKFRNRESRPEDLQVIAELKDMVTEREALVKKLVVGARKRGTIWTSAYMCVGLVSASDHAKVMRTHIQSVG